MKKLLFIFLAIFAYATPSFGQKDYVEQLYDLLHQSKAFEARDFYLKHRDVMPDNDPVFDLIYKSTMAQFLNKPDSAALYLENLIGAHEWQLGPNIIVHYKNLLSLYSEMQRFEDGLRTCDRLLDYLERNPFDLPYEHLNYEHRAAEIAKNDFNQRNMNEPRRRIERYGTAGPELLDKDEHIRFNAEYNGIQAETLFDTGATPFLTTSLSVAERIGVRAVPINPDTTITINGKELKGYTGIVDSISLKGVRLYNIPVTVMQDGEFTSHVPDSLIDKFASINDIILMGLPTMKMIGQMEFDWDNRTISFPNDSISQAADVNSNLIFVGNTPFLRIKVNGLNLVGHFDTGSASFVKISFSFFERNKSRLQIDTMTQKKPYNYFMLTDIYYNIKYEILVNPVVYSDGRRIRNDDKIIIKDPLLFSTIEGTIGVHFVKALGRKVLFDFNRMKLKCSD